MQWQKLVGQFANDGVQQLGVEHAGRFAQRSQRGLGDSQFPLHFAKTTGLLDATQAGQDGIEEVEKHHRGVLIVEQLASCLHHPLRARIVKLRQKWLQEIEILEGFEILLGELRLGIAKLFVQRWLLPWLSFVFWGRDDYGKAPPTRIGRQIVFPRHDSCQFDS